MSVAIILGAGGRVGKAVATKLANEGYKIALVSRSGKHELEGPNYLSIKGDVTHTEDITEAFAVTESKLGAPPNVVIYNTAQWIRGPVEDDPFSLPQADFETGLSIGALSVYPSITQSLAAFKRITDEHVPKVFIATSNLLTFLPATPGYLALGSQKRLLGYLIETAAATPSYTQQGFKFYLGTQTSVDGKLPGPLFNGEAHAVAYWKLVKEGRADWDVRFDPSGNFVEKK